LPELRRDLLHPVRSNTTLNTLTLRQPVLVRDIEILKDHLRSVETLELFIPYASNFDCLAELVQLKHCIFTFGSASEDYSRSTIIHDLFSMCQHLEIVDISVDWITEGPICYQRWINGNLCPDLVGMKDFQSNIL